MKFSYPIPVMQILLKKTHLLCTTAALQEWKGVLMCFSHFFFSGEKYKWGWFFNFSEYEFVVL